MGKPPAAWVYELLKLDLPEDYLVDYRYLSEKFGVSLRALRGFCAKLNIPGQYYRKNTRGVRKRFYLSELKSHIRAYLKSRGRI